MADAVRRRCTLGGGWRRASPRTVYSHRLRPAAGAPSRPRATPVRRDTWTLRWRGNI